MAEGARTALATAFVALCSTACASSQEAPSTGPLGAGDGGHDAAVSREDAGADIYASDSAADSGVSLIGDGSTVDASAACHHLNIGILGNPGANASSDFQAWLVTAGTSVQRIQTAAPTPAISASTLQPFDVVILDWLTRDYTTAEAAVLAAFVTAGGGLVSMSGYDNVTADDWHANSLLAPLGVAYYGSLLIQAVTDFAPHPITMGLTSVTFEGGYAVQDLGGAASTRTPIAFLPDAADGGLLPVAYAVQMGGGRAFVWGDEWIEFDSEWSTLPEIKQLWVQVFAWIAPPSGCGLQPQ
jgi:hypothetical protein